MRKATIFLIFFISVFLGCSKKADDTSEGSIERIKKLQSTSDISAQRQIFQELSPEEAYQTWIDHFQEYKQIDSIGSNSAKLSLIESLETSLSAEIFEDSSDASIVFINYTYPLWFNRAKGILTDKEIFDLCYVNRFAPEIDSPGDPVPDCFCHVGNSGYSCKTYSLGIPSGVTVHYGVCVGGATCDYSRRGCGALWLESCSGANCSF